MPYLLSINCGSSSIKGKLFSYTVGSDVSQADKSDSGSHENGSVDGLTAVAEASVKGITAKGEKVKLRIHWLDAGKEEGRSLGKDVDYEGEDGDKVEYQTLPPLLLEKLTGSTDRIQKDTITHIAHRVVHGGPHTKPIIVTKDHDEGLKEMDVLSTFAPLHNHSAVLAVRACLDALPNHTSVLCFDTLFHQTLPQEVYTYPIAEPEEETPVPIRKYGFHGLSYMSILDSVSREIGKKSSETSLIVAHLGSGGSVCCIRKGKSNDTSMGLTPLEGLVGGTRSGSIDPTAVFHLVKDCSEDAGVEGMEVTKAEYALNKKSGLSALAGTSNFGTITSRISDPSSCSKSEHEGAKLAYNVYLDRLMGYLYAYLGKLKASLPTEEIDGLVFSGGIGEKASTLRADVARQLEWCGASLDNAANEEASGGKSKVAKISDAASKLSLWVVQTDEELTSAKLAVQACQL